MTGTINPVHYGHHKGLSLDCIRLYRCLKLMNYNSGQSLSAGPFTDSSESIADLQLNHKILYK